MFEVDARPSGGSINGINSFATGGSGIGVFTSGTGVFGSGCSTGVLGAKGHGLVGATAAAGAAAVVSATNGVAGAYAGVLRTPVGHGLTHGCAYMCRRRLRTATSDAASADKINVDGSGTAREAWSPDMDRLINCASPEAWVCVCIISR